MALYWDVSEVKDHAVVTTVVEDGVEKWHPVTIALVNATMAFDIGRIDAAHLDEILWRLAYLEVLGEGKFLIDWHDASGKELASPRDRNFTRDEVERHVGMTTNVSTIGRKEWLQRVHRGIAARADRIVLGRYAKAKAAAEVQS